MKPLRRTEDPPAVRTGQPIPIAELTAPSHDVCDCNAAVPVPEETREAWEYAGFEVEAVSRGRIPQLCATCYEALRNDWAGSSVSDWSVVLHCRTHPEYLLAIMAMTEVNGRALGAYGAEGLRRLLAWATSHEDARTRLVDGAPDVRETERRAMIAGFAERLLAAAAEGYTASGNTILAPSEPDLPDWLTEEEAA